MSVKNQSEFDSKDGAFTIYQPDDELPKEASPFLYVLEKYKDKDEKDE